MTYRWMLIALLVTACAISPQVNFQPRIESDVNGTLLPGHLAYHPIAVQDKQLQATLIINSTLPLDIYIVPSQDDLNKALNSENFSVFAGCSREEISNAKIICNVHDGGIMLQNAGIKETAYQLHFEAVESNKEPSIETTTQKTTPLRWNHLPVTYEFVDKECKLYQAQRFRSAVAEIEETTPLQFTEVSNNPDISIRCTLLDDCYEEKVDIDREKGIITTTETICEHAAGLAQITETQAHIIKKATIEFFGFAGFAESGYAKKPSGFSIGDCGHTTTEIHEILHVFGFEHSPDNESIMYHEQTANVGYTLREPSDCLNSKKEIDDDIVNQLNDLYDLYD